MSLVSVIPVIAAVLFVLFLVVYCIWGESVKINNGWIFPAILSLLFTWVTTLAIMEGGTNGFWFEHIRNFWGNQIWCDLVMAGGIGWFFIVPQAKKQKMKIIFWLIFVLCTGCIGLMSMVSRLLYLQEYSAKKI